MSVSSRRSFTRTQLSRDLEIAPLMPSSAADESKDDDKGSEEGNEDGDEGK